MHPTATKCVQWAAVLMVLGAVVLIYGTELYVGLADLAGANAEAGLSAVNIVLTIVRSAAFPTGAALIGAAVVIQALARRDVTPYGRRENPRAKDGRQA